MYVFSYTLVLHHKLRSMHVFSMESNESFPKKATNMYNFSFFSKPEDGGNGSHKHIERVH
jgi:hypothetical protein